MRNFIKKQLLEIMQTIYEAINLCKKQPDINLLADCQNAAVFIGEKIEETEGEGTAAVMQLERFTDFLYDAGLVIDSASELRKALNKARDKLKQAEHEIKAKLSVNYEILFLPYKVSMWDALDSIYREAAKQENCHVVVMPIPYFNINPQRQILGMEYEGNQFPADVEITNYNNYNIPENQPDVIFIHNPYDDCNFVTQVPPQYFSAELAKYTDKLVYIPYFVNDGSTIREHYCETPAVQNAWRTFVHSEKVREVYCKFHSPEKIVALGSPKFDMVVKYDSEKPDIPEDWARAFNGRTVFLYNTHLRNIMGHAEKMIEKLDYVFSVFEKRSDAALLWRPHPLSIQTAKSMSPYILDRYLKLIDRFKKIPNGIYDDTADIHRAIAISDAYIGDWSSVVSMYGMTGKPIFVMNEPEIYEDDPLDYLLIYSKAKNKDAVYTFSSEYNALMRIEGNTAKYVCSLDREKIHKVNMFFKIIEHNGNFFLLPGAVDYIAQYNPASNQIEYYDLGINASSDDFEIMLIARHNNSIYIGVGINNCIVKFDMDTKKFKYFKNILTDTVIDCNKKAFYYAKQVDEYIYIPSLQSNEIIVWNMIDDTYSIKKIPYISDGCFDIELKDSDIYILTRNERDLLKWNRIENTVECILKNTAAHRIYAHKNKLFLLPDKAENICVLDTDDLKYTKIDYPDGYMFLHTYRSTNPRYPLYEIEGNLMLLYSRNANMQLELNMDTCTLTGKKIALSDELKEYTFKKHRYISSNYTYLDGRCSLQQFIDFAGEDTYKDERKKYLCRHLINTDGTSGKKILEYVISSLK